MFSYRRPAKVEHITTFHQQMLTTQTGGRVAVDNVMFDVWKQAHGCTIDQALSHLDKQDRPPNQVRAALACLAEAGLLERSGYPDERSKSEHDRERAGLVSVIIVSYNSRAWLEGCFRSLHAQSYSPLEIILVDNASQDGSAGWVAENNPEIRLIRLNQIMPLAYALNQGVAAAQGEYHLLLNPDIELEPDTIGQMVSALMNQPACAAVTAKLKFTWARAFLNGLGSYVGAISWGTDSALGHLDLGQFDYWQEVPSACFAATLVPAPMWQQVGPIDEGFPLYYEDSEWSYRARILGYSIIPAPGAIVYHAFSGHIPTGERTELGEAKLHNVVYGRLRFITRLLGPAMFTRFLVSYMLEDSVRFCLALFRGQGKILKAYSHAWMKYYRSIPSLQVEREEIQNRRQRTDRQVFKLQRQSPAPLIRNGIPVLTWDLVCNYYYPLIASGQTRQIPEFTGQIPAETVHPANPIQRATGILRAEGLLALIHRVGRHIQWKLSLP